MIQGALRSTLFLITNTSRRRLSDSEGQDYIMGLEEASG
jgi:hypothetical protein